MEERRAIQKAIRQKYAILAESAALSFGCMTAQEFKTTYCATCARYDSNWGCQINLLPVTSQGTACPYHSPRLNEAPQSKSTGIETPV